MSTNKKISKRSKPAYQRIKESILKNIHSGKWQAGAMIPTENALALQFGVSRMTVNRALKELSQDKVLQRRQGSGTFVAQQQYNNTIVEVRNIAADIKVDKKQYEAKVIVHRSLLPTDISPNLLSRFIKPMLDDNNQSKVGRRAQASQLSTKHASKNIVEVKIIHFADGAPIQFEERWVDADLVPEFIHQDFTVTNTSDYLIAKAPLEGGSYSIRAVAAPKEVAEALQINDGECALLISRQTYSSGKVVTFVKMWHAGSRYQFSGTL